MVPPLVIDAARQIAAYSAWWLEHDDDEHPRDLCWQRMPIAVAD